MSQHPTKLVQFWKELTRRRVVHVVTVYASAAFVIVELVNNLTEPLNLPSFLATIVVIVLAVGFPLAVILSWIYDLSGEGFERTKPMEKVPDEQKTSVPNTWKIATIISFLVILVLVTFNIIGNTKKLQAGDIQSLVILPFENLTGDDQLENMVSSMHALLIGDIGRIGGLRVTGRTTSSTYKDVNLSAPEIASELNVDAIVEATVMCLGDSVCVQFSLVKTIGDEEQLWVAEYKEDKSQMLNLYNRITRQIAEEVMIELTPDEKRLLSKSRTVSREAMDEYLNARAYWDDFSKESLYKALDYLNDAIKKEPNWAPLYSGLANVWMGIQQLGFESPSVAAPIIYESLNKAIELDTELFDSHYLSGIIAHVMEWDWEKAEREFLKALTINPNDALSRIFYAQLLCVLQRNDEAAAQGQLAFDLDPLNPLMKGWYGALLMGIGDCQTPISFGEEVVAVDPENYFGNATIEGAAYACKEYDKVIKAVRYALPFPLEEDSYQEIELIYIEHGIESAYLRITKLLEEFAQNNPVTFMDLAFRYIIANQPEKAMDWIEKGYEMHDPQMTYITTQMYNLEPLFTYPRFIEIVEKMNLPLPEPN